MEERYARIEDYLEGKLDETGRLAFEAELLTDPDLAQALLRTREAHDRLARQWASESHEQALKQTLKNMGSRHFGEHATTRNPLRAYLKWFLAAAAVLVALLVWLKWPSEQETLYAETRRFPAAAFTLRGNTDQNLGKAAQAFNREDYPAALALLQNHLGNRPDDLEARFFAGLSQLELKRLEEAEATFRQLSAGRNAWAEEARWYLALTLLRKGKTGDCMDILQQIQPGGAHFAEAQTLLKALR
jgi:tetratricopeptide (TPR) repeat protein